MILQFEDHLFITYKKLDRAHILYLVAIVNRIAVDAIVVFYPVLPRFSYLVGYSKNRSLMYEELTLKLGAV